MQKSKLSAHQFLSNLQAMPEIYTTYTIAETGTEYKVSNPFQIELIISQNLQDEKLRIEIVGSITGKNNRKAPKLQETIDLIIGYLNNPKPLTTLF